jgi:hypothetical protein
VSLFGSSRSFPTQFARSRHSPFLPRPVPPSLSPAQRQAPSRSDRLRQLGHGTG